LWLGIAWSLDNRFQHPPLCRVNAKQAHFPCMVGYTGLNAAIASDSLFVEIEVTLREPVRNRR